MDLEFLSVVCCVFPSSCWAAALLHLSSGWKDSTVCLGQSRKGPASSALNKHQILWAFLFTVMKHIISWVLWLPSSLTIPPSRPAPPHFEPPPRLGRGVGRACSPAGVACSIPPHHPSPRPHRLPANSLPGFIFLPLLYSFGVKGLFKLGTDEAYNKILCLCSNFHSKGKMLYGPDLLWISSSAYIYLQSRKKLFVTSFICTTRETEAWRGLPHCDHMLGYWVTYTLKR